MIAVIVATEREASAARPVLSHCARLFVSGVGKVNAAIAASNALNAGARVVVNAGLAGAIFPWSEVGTAYSVSKATQYDFDLSAVDGVGVGVVDVMRGPFFRLSTVGGMPVANVGTADRFVATPADRSMLAAAGCMLVDMECAAVAQVCEKARVPCYAVKVVSDGNDGSEYRRNADACLPALAKAVSIAVGYAEENTEKSPHHFGAGQGTM